MEKMNCSDRTQLYKQLQKMGITDLTPGYAYSRYALLELLNTMDELGDSDPGASLMLMLITELKKLNATLARWREDDSD